MKILFLDVDGVLNKTSDYEVIMPDNHVLRLNTVLVGRLKRVLEVTDAKVVLSSTWRLTEGGREFLEASGIPIMDRTHDPEKDKVRGHQIQRWLNAYKAKLGVESYAIVDDESDMLYYQLYHLVQTETEFGLTGRKAYQLAYKLGYRGHKCLE